MASQLTNKQKMIVITKKSLFVIWIAFKWTFVFGLVGALLVGGVLFGYITSLVRDDDVRDAAMIVKEVSKNDLTGFVYFRDGTLVGQLRTDEDRILATSIDEIPQVVRDAIISVEDFRFEDHLGVDLIGTIRAAKQKFTNDDKQTGGSTITQQLARRVFLSLEQTDSRKFKEIFLAMRMERIMVKDDILLAYLNKMPFGNGSNGYNVYGIKAAAKGIFDIHDMNRLNVAQSAYLAGLLKAPSDYSAFNGKGQFNESGFESAMKRQKVVLHRMLEVGKITQDEYDRALSFDVKSTLAPTKEKAYTTFPYLMIEAERKAAEALLMSRNPQLTEAELRSKASAELVRNAIDMMNRSGYKIYTTIDKDMYEAMHEIGKNPDNYSPDHPEKGVEQTSAIMLDNKTGAILSMLEGRDYYIEQLNHATQMKRQPGSAMKAMAYIPALEMGVIQPGSPIDDAPIILKDGGKGAHLPENWDDKFHGIISARVAFNQSYNIPALKLFLPEFGGVGIETAWEYAQKMGITTLTKRDYSAQTGIIGGLTEGTTLEELTNAYMTVPNKGVFKDAYMIERIEDPDGKVIYQHSEQPVQVFSEETAYLMADMMRTVLDDGTAKVVKSKFEAKGKIPIFGKTGTTSNDFDVWFIGFTPDVTLGVWTGYDQPSKLTKNGTQRSKEIWPLIMNTAVKLKPDWFTTDNLEKPANIMTATISSVSGKLPNELTLSSGMTTTDILNKKFLPVEEEDGLVKVRVVRYNKSNYIPQASTPADFVEEKVMVNRERPIATLIQDIRETFEKYPKSIPGKNNKMRRAEDYFIPDAYMDAPTVVDPRNDDGMTPPAPVNVRLAKDGDHYKITFNPVDEDDVIGYRVYMSSELRAYARLSGTVVYAGEETVFSIPAKSDFDAFYLTTVDVAGNESPASRIITAGGVIDPNWLPPPGDGDSSSGGAVQSGVPAPPQGVRVRAREGGEGVLLQWNASPEDGVREYKVYSSSSATGNFRFLGSIDSTRFEYLAYPPDGWYRVTAVGSGGESSPSQAVEMKTAD